MSGKTSSKIFFSEILFYFLKFSFFLKLFSKTPQNSFTIKDVNFRKNFGTNENF